jgi:hypothetical protein
VGDRNGQAQVYLGLGELDQLADPKASRASYMLAYRIYLNTESKEGQGTALRHLGDLDASLNQEAPARQNYEQATGAYKHVNNQIGQAEVLKSTGNLERKLGNVEARTHRLQRCVRVVPFNGPSLRSGAN